jgi:hypothetical protein
MVPIHDTDVGEERWSKASWDGYELWEKVEGRKKRSKHLWVIATFILFIILSAVPVALDQWPKWMTEHLTGKLAREISRIKREASIARSVYRITFAPTGQLSYTIEKVKKCSDLQGEVFRSDTLAGENVSNNYTLISASKAESLEIPGLVSQFCFDPLSGSGILESGKNMAGFGIISVNDLTEKRLDRMSLLLLSGPSAEISFE